MRSYTVRVGYFGNINTHDLAPGDENGAILVSVNGTSIPHDGYRNFTVQHGDILTINTTLRRFVKTGSDSVIYEIYGRWNYVDQTSYSRNNINVTQSSIGVTTHSRNTEKINGSTDIDVNCDIEQVRQ